MIVCPRCKKVSHHPEDEAQGYCSFCHWWTSDPQLGAPEVIAQAVAEGAIPPIKGIYPTQIPVEDHDAGRGTIAKLRCRLGFHRFVGQSVPHTYACACGAVEAGYP